MHSTLKLDFDAQHDGSRRGQAMSEGTKVTAEIQSVKNAKTRILINSSVLRRPSLVERSSCLKIDGKLTSW